MAYGSGAWQNDPRVANKESNDKNGFDRMMQLAALASMMDNKTALGFGLGNLLADYFSRARARTADKKADTISTNGTQPQSGGFNPQPYNLPSYQNWLNNNQDALAGSAGMKPGKNYAVGLEPYTRTAWQDTPTSAEVQQAAASVFGQTPQGAAGATVSAPTTLTLVNPAGAQQYQWPAVDTDWLHRNS